MDERWASQEEGCGSSPGSAGSEREEEPGTDLSQGLFPYKAYRVGLHDSRKNRIHHFFFWAWNPERCSLALSAVNMILGSSVSTSLRWFLVYKSGVSPFSVVHVSRSSTDFTEQLSLSLLVFGRRACIVMRSFVAFIYLP